MSVPLNKNDAHGVLRDIWAGSPEAEAGRLIVDFLSEHTDSVHISYSQLFQVGHVPARFSPNVVLNIINYLTGTDLNLLTTGFEYIEGDFVQRLDIDQVQAAHFRQINPFTGEEDEEVRSKIFMYFSPSELAKKALVA